MKNTSRRRKKASRRSRLILLLALIIPTSGWTVTKIAVNLNFPTVSASADQNNLDINTALKDFKDEKKNFITQLNNAVNEPKVKNDFNSVELNNKLVALNRKIDGFKKQNLSKLNQPQRQEINRLIKAVKTNNKEVLDKIIKPLQQGLGCNKQTGKNCTNLETVQTNLYPANSPKIDGELGTGTIGKIDDFLSAKISDSEEKLQSVRQQIPELQSDAGTGADADGEAETVPGADANGDAKTIAKETLTEEQKKQIESLIDGKLKEIKQEHNKLNIISLVALSLSIIALLSQFLKPLKLFKNRSRRHSNNPQNSFPTHSVSSEQEVEVSVGNNHDIPSQYFTRSDDEFNSRVNSRIDSKLKPIKHRLEEIEKSLQLKNQRYPISPDVESNQREKTSYSPVQPISSSENIVEPLPQASNYLPPRLVQTYNRDPRSSTQNAIEVSETQKSMSDRSLGISNTVTLENKNRGSYAIVAEGNINYLVPNKSLRITDSNYKTVQGLFECRGYKKGYSENFQLIKPATVYSLSGNQQWQLQERGILEF